MKIIFNITLNEGDIEEIKEDFMLAGYKYNEADTIDGSYEEVEVNTSFLREKEPLVFIKQFLDMGYSLEWNKDYNSYIITDNS